MTFGERKTPLRRKTPMKSGTKQLAHTAMKRATTALPKVGKKARADSAAIRSIAAKVKERAGDRCEFGIPGVCRFVPNHLHHRKLRRFGDHSFWNLVFICTACHDYAHAHALEAYEKGWLVSAEGNPTTTPWVNSGRRVR